MPMTTISRICSRRLFLAAAALLPIACACGQGAPTLTSSPVTDLVSSDSVTVTATPSTTTGLNRVRFYQNGALAATDTTSPYEVALNDLRQNAYEITARAEYTGGNFDSTPLSFTVGAPSVTLAITALDPLSPGSVSAACVPYQSSGGAVDSVAFYLNGRFVSRDRTVPYTATAIKLVSNIYQITARADYRNNDTFESNAVSFGITPPATSVKVKPSKGGNRSIIATGIVNPAAPGDVDYVQFRLSTGATITDSTAPYKVRFRNLTGRKYRVSVVVDLDNGEDLKATSKVVRFRK
jgi:Bacterial Ig domain